MLNPTESAALAQALCVWRGWLDNRHQSATGRFIPQDEFNALWSTHDRLLAATDSEATRLTAPVYEYGWTPDDPYGPGVA